MNKEQNNSQQNKKVSVEQRAKLALTDYYSSVKVSLLSHKDVVFYYKIFIFLAIFLFFCILVAGVSYYFLSKQQSYNLYISLVHKDGSITRVEEAFDFQKDQEEYYIRAYLSEYVRKKFSFLHYKDSVQAENFLAQKVDYLSMFGELNVENYLTRMHTNLVSSRVLSLEVVPRKIFFELNEYKKNSDPQKEKERLQKSPEFRHVIVKVEADFYYRLYAKENITRVFQRNIFIDFRYRDKEDLADSRFDPRMKNQTKYEHLNPLGIEILEVNHSADVFVYNDNQRDIFNFSLSE